VSDQPYVIGVTGNIACGKSLVMSYLADLGAETIDGDRVYHRLIAPNTPLWRALRERFGDGIIREDGAIDRPALGIIVFSDPRALADLDALTHPAIVADIRSMIARSMAPTIAVDAVKLIESGLDRDCDSVWVVTCDPEVATQRLMARNGLSLSDAAARVSAQPEIAPKLARADVIIDNSGSRESTREQVETAWRRHADSEFNDDRTDR
jgi:dephospho-CoA kinase